MFTAVEIRDIIVSILLLALIFSSFQLELLPTTIILVIFVFLSHELSHKFVAQHFGCSAEYKIWPLGLLLGLITAILSMFGGGIVFAAPGAVYISPYVKKRFAFKVAHLTEKEYGIISLAGPVVNISIGISLLLVSLFSPLGILSLIAKISFFLAFFNLIPIYPMDGSKVIAWNWKIWLITIVLASVGLFL
jgi:Zn-dependent protease